MSTTLISQTSFAEEAFPPKLVWRRDPAMSERNSTFVASRQGWQTFNG